MVPAEDNPLSARLALRPVASPDDDDFLRELYMNSREDLSGVFADGEQMRQLLLIQFRAQAVTYSHQFPDASHDIVELDGDRIGRTILDRKTDAVHIVDISLVPDARGRGIGTAILSQVLDDCASTGRVCTLQVVKTNRAQTLYRRLGFEVTGDDGMRLSMRWSPNQTSEQV